MNFSFEKVSHSDFSQKILSHIYQNIASETLNISEKEYNQLKNANSEQIKSFIDSVFTHKTKWNQTKRDDFYHWADKNVFSNFRVEVSENNFSVGTEKKMLSYDIFLERKPEFDTISIGNHQMTRHELKLVYDDKTKTDSLIAAKWKNIGFFKRLELKNILYKTGVFSFGNVTQMTQFIDTQIKNYLSVTSYTMLLMLPFVSFLLFVFFRKKHKKLYIHLIHSLHLHSIIYLFTSILIFFFLTMEPNVWFWLLYLLFIIGLPIYFMISNRILYQENWLPTIFKSMIFCFLYFGISLFFTVYIGFLSIMYT